MGLFTEILLGMAIYAVIGVLVAAAVTRWARHVVVEYGVVDPVSVAVTIAFWPLVLVLFVMRGLIVIVEWIGGER